VLTCKAEKVRAENERLAYINQPKADEAREEGNTFFKAGDYPGAVKAYSEAIKRAPDDARGYGNRAAAYIKLASFPEALKVTPSLLNVLIILCRTARKPSLWIRIS
jgi:stress-induced-phosphoprotein 1